MWYMQRKALILLVAVPIFCLFYCLPVRLLATIAVVEEMTAEERSELERLFQNLFLENHFAYTLLGDKPVSVAGHFNTPPLGNLHINFHTFKTAWLVWEKYKNKVTFNDYLLIQLPRADTEGMRTITFIDKKAFLKTVRSHLDLFQLKLGHEVSPEKLLSEIEKEEQDLWEILGKNEALYGILLGYGRRNSLLYERFAQIFSKVDRLQARGFTLQWPCPGEGYSSLEEELHSLQSKLRNSSSPAEELNAINPVCFRGDHGGDETKGLRREYKRLQRLITLRYAKGEILKTTLELLTDGKESERVIERSP